MAVSPPAFLPPPTETEPGRAPDGEPSPVRMVGDQKAVKVEPLLSPLSRPGKPVFFKGITVLTLEDGTQLHGCADCETTGTRGQITRHRVEAHGSAKLGSRGSKDEPVDLTGRTVGELMELASFGLNWEPVVTMHLNRIDELTDRATVAERELEKIKRALAKIGFVLKTDED